MHHLSSWVDESRRCDGHPPSRRHRRVIREVLAEPCDNCGEYYVADSVTQEILKLAERAADRGVEVEALRYAA